MRVVSIEPSCHAESSSAVEQPVDVDFLKEVVAEMKSKVRGKRVKERKK